MRHKATSRILSINGTLLEKQVEHLGDKVMQTLGFEIVRFSQPRNTMQTAGISDRLYVHPTKKLHVWWEAKREGGKQSYAQMNFQAMIENIGWVYVVGTDDALLDWCRAEGLCK